MLQEKAIFELAALYADDGYDNMRTRCIANPIINENVKHLALAVLKGKNTMEFQAFPKMARLSREMIITEKIDGTNAQIVIASGFQFPETEGHALARTSGIDCDQVIVAGSRTRYLTVENDNQGFARWVKENATELFTLGPGRHFGEWWGSGIQRGYGLTKGDKRFSLFNTSRWAQPGAPLLQIPNADPRIITYQEQAPACCGVVPVLYQGEFRTLTVEAMLCRLGREGSSAAPGYMNPEGVVVYHTQGNVGFKKTILKDEEHKGKRSSE